MIVTSEVIKNAVVRRLLTVYPNISVYKEAITLPTYPNFFVNLLQVNAEEQRKGKFILTFNLEIRYRHIADPTTDLKLQQDLDDVGITLSNAFHLIDLGDSKIKCEDKYYEKVDGVLHFFFNLREMVESNDIEEYIKQNKLDLTFGLKDGGSIDGHLPPDDDEGYTAIVEAIINKGGKVVTADSKGIVEAINKLPIVPSEELEEFDYNCGFVARGIWTYEKPTDTLIDIYRVKAGHKYWLSMSKNVGTRFRAIVVDTDIRNVTSGSVTGTNIVFKDNPKSFENITFISNINGFLILSKDNAGVRGLTSFLVDIT